MKKGGEEASKLACGLAGGAEGVKEAGLTLGTGTAAQ
jgi:hypothetical protein